MPTFETEVSRSAVVEDAVFRAAWHRKSYNESTSTFLENLFFSFFFLNLNRIFNFILIIVACSAILERFVAKCLLAIAVGSAD